MHSGGAVANNNLTYTDKPDTKTQTSQYISDVKAKTVNRGSGTVLHIWWIGINSITQIWTDAIKKDPSVRSQAVLDEANARVDQQIAEVESQVRNVRTDAEVNKLSISLSYTVERERPRLMIIFQQASWSILGPAHPTHGDGANVPVPGQGPIKEQHSVSRSLHRVDRPPQPSLQPGILNIPSKACFSIMTNHMC